MFDMLFSKKQHNVTLFCVGHSQPFSLHFRFQAKNMRLWTRTNGHKTFYFCIGYLTCQSNLSISLALSLARSLLLSPSCMHNEFVAISCLGLFHWNYGIFFDIGIFLFWPCDNSIVVALMMFSISKLPFCIYLCIALTSLSLTRNISLSPLLSPPPPRSLTFSLALLLSGVACTFEWALLLY